MPVDPAIQQVLDFMEERAATDPTPLTPEALRAAFKEMRVDGAEVPVAGVEERTVPGPDGPVPVRVYTPEGEGPHPVLVWFHGGGFVIGDLDTADSAARKLCRRAEAVVVSVDYRLAPEHPAPAALEDCWAVTAWVAQHAAELQIDPGRLAVGGDSAGGNLAALVALRARDQGAPAIAAQVLVYPVVDLAATFPSVVENGEGYFLTRSTMEWFTEQYLTGSPYDVKDPAVSPLYAESLEGLPPATVLTAEFDPLRDEGEAYAERLRDSGVPVELTRYDGMIHGFFQMGSITPVGDQAVDAAADALRRRWSS